MKNIDDTLSMSAKCLMSMSAKCLMALALGAGASFAFTSCHDAKAGKDNAEAPKYRQERPDAQLKALTKAMADCDARGFAHMCSYPIQRPYPLRDIEDTTAMVDYFPVMVDDSLQNAMRHVHIGDWEDYGWRGWSLKDSNPVWYDDGVEFVDYVSKAERGLQAMLAREEIETLSPELRKGWTPVMTLVQTEPDGDGTWIFRIDRKGETYRLAGYAPRKSLREMPEIVMDGTLTEEGSARSRDYVFSGADGAKAEYSPDSDDDDCLSMTIPPKPEVVYRVQPTYWRDHINR